MSISIEKIEDLKKRANISYEEAKKLLEKHNGDILEALIELEKKNRTYTKESEETDFLARIKKLFIKGNKTKFVVKRKDEIIVNIPVNFAILTVIMGFHLALVGVILIFVTGCKMTIKKPEGQEIDVDEAIVDVSEKVRKTVNNFDNENVKEKNENNSEKGYNEHTVE